MNKNYWFLLAGLYLSGQPYYLHGQNLPGQPQLNHTEHHATAEKNTQRTIQRLISHAIADFEQTTRAEWSYRIERYEDEEGETSSSVELYNPQNPKKEQWSLLSINGQKPSEKQQQSFAKRKNSGKDEQTNVSLSLREIIQLETLKITAEQSSFLEASFSVNLHQLDEEANKSLQGKLTFNKNKQFIESIVITNETVFSPMFSAKITEFELVFQFIKIGNAVLPQQNNLSMQGTFAFFTEINEVSTDTYSEYQYLGQHTH